MPDYGYFIGPGLKLLQGERLGSFYLQYNLIETFLFTAMIAAGLKVHWMAVVLSALFIGWYVIYWQIARRLFQHRFIALLCMAALVVTRFLAIRDHPVMWPQVLPLRLDLWAPVLLSVIAWGLFSWRTSLVFGITYALDSTFGFLFAAVYAAALAVAWWWSGDGKAGLRRGLLLILPAVAVGCCHKLVFGSFVSPAASHYLGVQIGFLPISSRSLFWPITMFIGWAAALFALHHKDSTARIGLLLAAFAAVQFVYFFGRSHDHNLLNISSVWLFLIFLAVDQAIEIGRARIFIAAGIVLALTVMSTWQFAPKVKRMGEKLRSGVWIVPHPLETALDDNLGRIDPNTVLADSADAYLNYRLGLPQRGFYVPFEANVFMNDTAAWMDQQIREGRHVRTTDSNWSMWLPEFNETPIMTERGRRFSLVPNGFFMEIVESQSK